MRIGRPKHHGVGEDGQALAEFALLVPLLFLIVAGIVEFGRAWNIKIAVTDAAREGARYAVLSGGPTQSEVENTIKKRLSFAGIKNPDIVWPDGFHPVTGTTTLRVSTNYKMPWVGVLLSWGGGGTITIASKTAMRNEEAP